jgi:hypothetical protein
VKVLVIKWLVFLVLMGSFYVFDGFERPVVAREDYRGSRGMGRAWIATVLLFVAGSVMALWGNAIAQQVDGRIPDGLYPLIGVLLLITGFVWMMMVRDSVRL